MTAFVFYVYCSLQRTVSLSVSLGKLKGIARFLFSFFFYFEALYK